MTDLWKAKGAKQKRREESWWRCSSSATSDCSLSPPLLLQLKRNGERRMNRGLVVGIYNFRQGIDYWFDLFVCIMWMTFILVGTCVYTLFDLINKQPISL